MVSSEIKMMVAQNCSGYTSRSATIVARLGNLSESCSNCSYYVGERCIKGLFQDIRDAIKIN